MTAGVGPKIGPVQLLAIGFRPGAEFEGRVLQELGRLEESQTIRLLDLLFVRKDAGTGDLVVLDDEAQSLGGIIGALLGFEFDGVETPEAPEQTLEGHPFGLSPDDILSLADGIEPGAAGGFLLFEHVWARDLKNAIRRAGGVPIGEGFLTPAAIASVAVEVGAMVNELEALIAEEEDA